MSFSKDDDITDLIVPEDDLLSFQTPKFDAVRSAYSKNFQATSQTEELLQRINEIFPKKVKMKEQINDEAPEFNIDKDNDPLML